jgi:hypothetical protein
MKRYFLMITAALIGLGSVSVFGYDTSAPVPIHRTTAKRRVVKPVRKPVEFKKAAKPAVVTPTVKPAASSAK